MINEYEFYDDTHSLLERTDKHFKTNDDALDYGLEQYPDSFSYMMKRLGPYVPEEKEEKEEEDGVKWTAETWPYRYACRWWMHIEHHGWISRPWKENKDEVLQEWADELHKIVRTSKGTKEELDLVLEYIFTIDDWWVPEGNLRSPSKLHKKNKQNRNETYFEKFRLDAKNWKESKGVPLPSKGEVVLEPRYNEIVEAHGEEIKEKFVKRGFGTGRNADKQKFRYTG